MVSGGQAERACAARAIFMNPEIILADEPTNNLDPEKCQECDRNVEEDPTRIESNYDCMSHDGLVEEYATQVVSIKDGRAYALTTNS